MGRARALKVELEPGPSLALSENVKHKPWRASNFYNIYRPIFWTFLKKSNPSLDWAWALLKMSNTSPPKKAEPEPNLGSDLSLIVEVLLGIRTLGIIIKKMLKFKKGLKYWIGKYMKFLKKEKLVGPYLF